MLVFWGVSVYDPVYGDPISNESPKMIQPPTSSGFGTISAIGFLIEVAMGLLESLIAQESLHGYTPEN